MPHPWPLIGFLIMVMALAAGSAALLRRCGLSSAGARTLGGALAGLLLGPSFLGAIAPETYRFHVLGGTAEHDVHRSLMRRQTADMIAAEAARTAPEEMQRVRERHAMELENAEGVLNSAERHHQFATRLAICGLTALVLLGSNVKSVRNRDPRQGWASLISIGLWSAVFPGSLAYAAAVWWWGFTEVQAGILAAAVSIGPWALTAVDIESADQVEFGGARMVQTSGCVASAVAIVVCVIVLLRADHGAHLWWSLPLLALPVGWMLEGFGWTVSANALQKLFDNWLIPALAGLVAVQIQIFENAILWPVVVVAVLSGDGRWLGALIGAILPGGRAPLRAVRLVLGSMAAGPTQLSIAGIAMCLPWASTSLGLAVLGGAILIELTVPLRRRLSEELLNVEMSGDQP